MPYCVVMSPPPALFPGSRSIVGLVLILLTLGVTVLAAATQDQAREPGEPPVSFALEIRPILQANCVRCHANGKSRGEFSLQTRDDMLEMVVPGDSEASPLIHAVRGDDPDLVMPYKADPLTPAQIVLLQCWIDEGALWDGELFEAHARHPHIAARRPELPPSREGIEHPIDRLLEDYFQLNEVEPMPVIDDASFARRVHLDLLGLLPPPESLATFVANDDPGKREALVAQLLAERVSYSAHWLSFWNDLLLNDYAGTGYIDGGRTQVTPWLLAALYDNKPYNQFVAELVNPHESSAGFARGIKWRGEVSASQRRELQYARNVCQVFLGVNMKCASCHDSFVDDWKLADAYGIAAIIADEALELHRCDIPTGEFAQASFLFPQLGAIAADAPRDERLAKFAQLMTHPNNGRFTRTIVNRIWARLMGRGLIEPVDSMDAAAWNEDVLEYLASELATGGYDLKSTMSLIATSTAYQRKAPPDTNAEADGEYVFRGPMQQRMTAEQFTDAVWTITGVQRPARVAPARHTDDDQAPEDAGDAGDADAVRAAHVNADELMRTLGRPIRDQVVTGRPNDLTTLQALVLTNGATLQQLLDQGGVKLAEITDGPAAIVDHVFRAALSRSPTEMEIALALEFLGPSPGGEQCADLLWAILMLPEFQLVR